MKRPTPKPHVAEFCLLPPCTWSQVLLGPPWVIFGYGKGDKGLKPGDDHGLYFCFIQCVDSGGQRCFRRALSKPRAPHTQGRLLRRPGGRAGGAPGARGRNAQPELSAPKHAQRSCPTRGVSEEQNFCFEHLRGFKTLLRLLITFHKTHSCFKSLSVAYLDSKEEKKVLRFHRVSPSVWKLTGQGPPWTVAETGLWARVQLPRLERPHAPIEKGDDLSESF